MWRCRVRGWVRFSARGCWRRRSAVIDELGYEQTTVGRITARARVSRRTFYELFGNREECLVALLEEVVARVERELAAAGLEGLAWRERVRGGLWAILSFLDREPVLARICVVQALHGGPAGAGAPRGGSRAAGGGARRGSPGGRAWRGVHVGDRGGLGGCGVRRSSTARLRGGDRQPLTGLLDELMGMIVLPYLGPRGGASRTAASCARRACRCRRARGPLLRASGA